MAAAKPASSSYVPLDARHLDRSPGPAAAYNIPGDFGAKKGAHLYSMASRLRGRRDVETPGPGRYDPHALAKDAGLKYSLAAKWRIRDKENVPGPGSYEPKLPPNNGPSYSLAGRLRTVRSDATPAPGTYSVLESKFKTLQATPKYSMASRPRKLGGDKDTVPGPGSYFADIAAKPTGPKYSLSARYRGKRDGVTPGPGAFETDKPLVGTNTPRFSFGVRTRNYTVKAGYFGDAPRLKPIPPRTEPIPIIHSV